MVGSLCARGQQRALSPLWNGTWVEDPARTSIFVPGQLLISPLKRHGTFLIIQDGEHQVVQCVPARASHAAGFCAELVPLVETSVPAPMGSMRAGVVYKPSAHGRELMVQNWRIAPDGSRLADTDTYRRAQATLDIVGRWRKVHSSEAPTTYQMSVKGSQLTIVVPDGEFTLAAKLDGSPTPFEGAYISSSSSARDGYTVMSPFELLETSYRNKRIVAHSMITLSPDGQTITEKHTPVGPGQHTATIVFARQK